MKRLLPYFKFLKPYWKVFALAILLGLIYGLITGYGIPKMIEEIIPVFFDSDQIPLITLLILATSMPIIMTIRAICGYFNTYLMSYCGIKVLEDLRLSVFKKLQTLPLSFYQNNQSGDLISRILGDTGRLQVTIVNTSNELIKQPFTLIGATIFFAESGLDNNAVLYIFPGLALIPICVFPVRYIGKKMLKKATTQQALEGGLTSLVNENLRGVREIRAFTLENRQQEVFCKKIISYFRAQMKVVKYSKILSPSIEVVSSFGICITIFLAGLKGVSQEEIIAIIAALFFSYGPVKKIGEIQNNLKRGLASLDRVEFITKHVDEVPEKSKAIILRNPPSLISIKDGCFSYNNSPPLFRNLNITILKNQVVGLVGFSGSGKSTFANLIPRFYDLKNGKIIIDSYDVKNLSKKSLRSQIAIVPQDPILFSDTLYHNILIGDLNADLDKVEEAAKNAQIHEFIDSLPDKYKSMVGENGTRLSGGQKQRIAIARAFLKNAPILILDEATSALDSESEEKIQEALKRLIKNKIVFIISHRFSTIQLCDRILVFNSGEIVGDGNHNELMQTNGLYQRLYENQQLKKITEDFS